MPITPICPRAAALALALSAAAGIGSPWAADDRWSVPPLVRSFIVQNCASVFSSVPEFARCVEGEVAGYAATVDTLTGATDPDEAAKRYRGCAGQDRSAFHHRFHRHRAACIAEPVG